MNTALLIIDIQKEYFPGGKVLLKGCEEASQRARQLLDYFRETRQPVAFIQHINLRPGAAVFLPGTPGIDLHPNIHPLDGETIVVKNYPNSFHKTNLLSFLQERQVERLVTCGMMTHMCIDTTVRAASDLGFTNLIAGDACATRDLTFEGQTVPADAVHAAFLAALHSMFGRVMRTAEILTQLRQETGQPA